MEKALDVVGGNGAGSPLEAAVGQRAHEQELERHYGLLRSPAFQILDELLDLARVLGIEFGQVGQAAGEGAGEYADAEQRFVADTYEWRTENRRQRDGVAGIRDCMQQCRNIPDFARQKERLAASAHVGDAGVVEGFEYRLHR